MWCRVNLVWTDVPPKHDLHGATSQKTAFFKYVAVIFRICSTPASSSELFRTVLEPGRSGAAPLWLRHCCVTEVLTEVNLNFLCLINWAPRRGGNGRTAASHFDLGTRWRRVVSFTPQPFTPEEKAPSTHWTGSWLGPRACWDTLEKRRICFCYRETNPDSYGSFSFRPLRRKRFHGPFGVQFCIRVVKLSSGKDIGFIFWFVLVYGLPTRLGFCRLMPLLASNLFSV
jgi:hypothetical protein